MKTIKINFLCDEIPKNYTGKIEYESGTKSWFLEGKRYRLDGPALEYPDGSKYYYVNNKLHRLDGPAIEHPNGHVEYWYNDEPTTKEALELLNNLLKLRNLK